MKPYLDYDGLRLYHAGALAALAEIADDSVDMCVTSPPFWGLRDYGTGRWEGGDADCDHMRPPRGGPSKTDGNFKSSADESRRVFLYAGECGKCGATRVDDQIGLEETPDAWADALAAVFDEVRRVLRPTGAMLVECGDSYNTSPSNGGKGSSGLTNPERQQKVSGAAGAHRPNRRRTIGDVKPKDLIGQPFLLAFALREAGWYWRGVYPWAKPNPMPESVDDRCTTAHSYVLHFTKSDRYFWDPDAIAEPVSENQSGGRQRAAGTERYADAGFKSDNERDSRATDRFQTAAVKATRNARSVWTIPTEPSGMGLCPVCHAFWPRNAPDEHCGVEVVSHYAAFPLELAEKAIRAASSERGVCPCGAPWWRIVEKGDPELAANTWSAEGGSQYDLDSNGHVPRTTLKHVRASETLGWTPSCRCGGDPEPEVAEYARASLVPDGPVDPRRPSFREAGKDGRVRIVVYPDSTPWPRPVPALVLDPFGGSGTTLLAARRLNRRAVAVELNPHYCEMTGRRLEIPEVIERAAATSAEHTQLALS